jgi:hypothetical protein
MDDGNSKNRSCPSLKLSSLNLFTCYLELYHETGKQIEGRQIQRWA